jgi:hypothetical protein
MSAFGPRATLQGRGDRGDAQAAYRRLERGDSSQTLRALCPGACPIRRGDEQGLMNSRYLAHRAPPIRVCVRAEPSEQRGPRRDGPRAESTER